MLTAKKLLTGVLVGQKKLTVPPSNAAVLFVAENDLTLRAVAPARARTAIAPPLPPDSVLTTETFETTAPELTLPAKRQPPSPPAAEFDIDAFVSDTELGSETEIAPPNAPELVFDKVAFESANGPNLLPMNTAPPLDPADMSEALNPDMTTDPVPFM